MRERSRWFNKSRWIWWLSNKPHTFRSGPVPCIRHNRVGLRCYRHPRTTQERRLLCDPLHREYGRARRRKLPHTWDDISFGYAFPKCWKDCSKKRKQWM